MTCQNQILLLCIVVNATADPKLFGKSADVITEREMLRPYEMKRLIELKSELETRGVHVQGFYHMTTHMPHWLEVYQEQLRLLAGYHRDLSYTKGQKIVGLMDLVERLNIFEVTMMSKGPKGSDVSVPAALDALKLGFTNRVRHKQCPSIDRNQYSYVQYFCRM